MLPAKFTLLQVTPALDAGGVEALTVDVARAAAEAGARSLVASRGGRLEGELARGGGELIRLPMDSRNPLTLLANAARLETVIREQGVSLVHVRSRAPAFSALRAARRAGVPIVATYHGIYSARSGLKRWYNAVMTRADRVIANSGFTRDHIAAEHAGAAARVAVIPEGVDTALFDPAAVGPERVAAIRAAWGLPADDPRKVILVAARLTGWKGHKVMVEALAGMAARTDTVLVFAGTGESSAYADGLRADAARLGLAEAVRLPGPCDDMPAAYAAADIVASPSVQAESFGRTVAEAGAMGRPTVVSGIGGAPEIIVDGVSGWLTPAGDGAAWVRALDHAMGLSPEDRAAMGLSARNLILSRFSVAAMCAATFDLYGQLCDTGRP